MNTDTDNGTEAKPKRKRRTPEEIAADKAAKEEAKRLKKGPWTLDELRLQCDEFVKALPHAKRISGRWERSEDCYVLNGEWSSYGVAEVVGSTGEIYETSLKKCTCRDFKSKRAECCKHQLCLIEYIRGNRTEEQRLQKEEQRQRREEIARHKREFIEKAEQSQLRMEREKTKRREREQQLEREQQEALEQKRKRRENIIIVVVFLVFIILTIKFCAG